MSFPDDISEKANWVLNLILIAMSLILLRAWHLAVVQHESKLEGARKPQNRTIMEPANRGTIRDRFNIPLAINKMQYNAAIIYQPIRHIPAVRWEKDEKGARVKKYKRNEHIRALAELYGKELHMDPSRIEDLIHSKASLYNQLPFVIKEDITEEQYYRLKMLEKDWLGIHVQHVPKRLYPHGRLASDIIGYIGAINREEYETIFQEIKQLKKFLEAQEQGESPSFPPGFSSLSQILNRLKDLEEKAYTINDYVGKAGIEGRFEGHLRGYHGKKSFYTDARGNFLRELQGKRDPVSGQRILLTISAELQQYAEQLLMENERVRKPVISGVSAIKQELMALQEPWIKGGAIIAMDPKTGELLAVASYPRIDPNDFVVSGNSQAKKGKQRNIVRWFETESYLADIWDQKRPLEREEYHPFMKAFSDESIWLTLENYLNFILPKNNQLGETHDVRMALKSITNIKNAVLLQKTLDRLLLQSGNSDIFALLDLFYPEDEAQETELHEAMRQNLQQGIEEKKKLDPFLGKIRERSNQVLLIDLLRMLVCSDRFDDALLAQVGEQSLESYRDISCAWVKIEEELKKMAKILFHEIDFAKWRKEESKEYLKQKRLEEKEQGRFAKPYIDYLDRKERELFQSFWEENKWKFALAFLLGNGGGDPYLDHFLTWHRELDQGAHSAIEWRRDYEALAHILKPLDSPVAYLKTLRSFSELDRPLYGRYRFLRNKGKTEKDLAAAFYPRYGFGYGRSYAYQQATHQGSIFKLVTAYEALIERYADLVQEGLPIDEASLNPLEIVDIYQNRGRKKVVGFHKDGSPIYQLYKKGRIPKSALRSIGSINLLKAIEMSSNPYFALLAGDILKDPENLAQAAYAFSFGEKTGLDLPGEIAGGVPKDLSENKTGLYAFSIGHHTLVVTPLQTAVMLSSLANGGKIVKPSIISMIAGRQPRKGSDQIFYERNFPYQENLSLLGIDFPLFTEPLQKNRKNLVSKVPVEIKREVFLPQEVRHILLKGMHHVYERIKTTGIKSLKILYKDYPEVVRDFVDFDGDLIGKSSTSESVENVNLDAKLGTHKFTHIWFGAISFQDRDDVLIFEDEYGDPELVVVVYLRFGEWGKDAGPVAAQIVKKWREIKAKNHTIYQN